MPVYNNESIYSMRIESSQDVEKAFQRNEKDKENVLEIMQYRYPNELLQISRFFQIGDLFKKAYWETIGFKSCALVVEGTKSCHTLLEHSLSICDDTLTPLFMRAFELHQTALQCFTMLNQRESAIAAMKETGEMAKIMTSTYGKLAQELSSLLDKDDEIFNLSHIAKEQFPLYQKRKVLDAVTEDKKIDALQAINSGILSLDNAIRLVYNLRVSLFDMKMLWQSAERHSRHLSNPDLADPGAIECMELCEPDAESKEFYQFLETAERAMNAMQPQFDENEFVMRTGRSAPLLERCVLTDLVKSMAIKGIEEEFEKSYLNWIALAKINQVMISTLKEVMEELQTVRNEIAQTEQEPLVAALHATVDLI